MTTEYDVETTYSVGDLLHGLDVITRDELVVRETPGKS